MKDYREKSVASPLVLRPLDLGGLSASEFNQTRRHLGPVNTTLADLDVTLVPQTSVREQEADFLWLTVTCGDASFAVSVTDTLANRLFEMVDVNVGSDFNRLTSIQVELAFDPILSALEDYLKQPVDIRIGRSMRFHAFSRIFGCKLDQVRGTITFHFDRPGCPIVNQILDWFPTHSPLNAAVPVPTEIEIGHIETNPRELAKLSRGAALLPAPQNLSSSSAVLIVGSRRFAEVELTGSTATIGKMSTMQDQIETSAPSAAGLTEIPVRVSFRINAFDISYDQLRSLDVGHVIDLKEPVETAQVDILANGKKIAQGEMVSLGQHLAIQVRELIGDD